MKWTRLSRMRFEANAVRLQSRAPAYNLANFLRTLATPEAIERWSLTSLRERLIKTGARLVRHGRYAVFRMAEAALPRTVFAGTLGLINGLRDPPVATVSVRSAANPEPRDASLASGRTCPKPGGKRPQAVGATGFAALRGRQAASHQDQRRKSPGNPPSVTIPSREASQMGNVG